MIVCKCVFLSSFTIMSYKIFLSVNNNKDLLLEFTALLTLKYYSFSSRMFNVQTEIAHIFLFFVL